MEHAVINKFKKNVFGLWLNDGFVLPPDGTDSPK
jgi:hypothetical protein